MKTSTHTRSGVLVAMIALVIIALQGASIALTVTTNKDNAPSDPLIAGSLRWAIVNTPAYGLVDFSASLKGKTIALKGGQLVVNKPMNIRGLGSGNLTVSGNNASRVFYVSGTGSVANPQGVIISDLTVTKGNAAGADLSGFGNDANGGAIHNVGTLQLLRVSVTGNSAALGSGGGIYNRGTLNAATECTVSYNSAGQSGGGIFDEQDLTVVRSAIFNNIAGGDGGGMQEAGTANLINTTVANNRAAGYGGGIFDSGGATLKTYNATIAGNTAAVGGGLATLPFFVASWELRNTLVGDNTAPDSPDVGNFFGSQISQGFNLIENTSGAGAGSFLPSDKLGVDAKLGPLQNNGGPTLTMALLPGSPAIDAGSNANLLRGMISDQRGFMARVINGGISATVDIGAYEYATAKALKQDAIDELTPCLGSADRRVVRDVRCAIRSIQVSLTARLWLGETRVGKCGELVFEYEEDAAYSLQRLLCYATDPVCLQAVQNAIEDLLLADEQLAVAEMDASASCKDGANWLRRAAQELAKARASAAKQQYKDAIEYYEHAWQYARKACNISTGDDDSHREREHLDREDHDRWGAEDRCGGDDDEERR